MLIEANGHAEALVLLPGTMRDRENLPALESSGLAFFHPPTGSRLEWKKNGDLEVTVGENTITIPRSGGVSIAAPSGVTVNGDLTVTGDSALGAVVTSSGINISGTHTHPVTTAPGTTGTPS